MKRENLRKSKKRKNTFTHKYTQKEIRKRNKKTKSEKGIESERK